MNEPSEEYSLLSLIADIRAAVGDPTGKLMQDELVEHCRRLREQAEESRKAELGWAMVSDHPFYPEAHYFEDEEQAKLAAEKEIKEMEVLDDPVYEESKVFVARITSMKQINTVY